MAKKHQQLNNTPIINTSYHKLPFGSNVHEQHPFLHHQHHQQHPNTPPDNMDSNNTNKSEHNAVATNHRTQKSHCTTRNKTRQRSDTDASKPINPTANQQSPTNQSTIMRGQTSSSPAVVKRSRRMCILQSQPRKHVLHHSRPTRQQEVLWIIQHREQICLAWQM